MMVFQIQLAKRQGVVPMTRDYIAREEARLRAREGGAARRCGSPASSARPLAKAIARAAARVNDQ